jgi:tRNA(Arg) A34 adenosine deaminase TadA
MNDIDRPRRPLKDKSFGGRHDKYMNILSKMASAVEPVRQARIAACLVLKNEIVSFGINQMKTHPFQAMYGKNKESIFLHAETDCIKNALREISIDDLTRCTLYVCRMKYETNEKKKFVYGLAKPCPGCARAIATFDIKNVFYSLDNNGYVQL